MPLISRLRHLPTAMGRCKYICCASIGIESNIRQLSTSTPTLHQSPLSVQLFPPSSNGFTLLYFPNKNIYGCNNRGFSSDGNNVPPVFYEERWDMRYQELVAYNDEHNDTLVPQNYPDNLQLGNWVHTQRQYKKNNKLAPERIDKLNEIGFVWDPLEDSWNEMLQQIVEYKDEHGDTLVPNNYFDNSRLGKWVTRQRYLYKCKQNGQATQMTDERVDKLNEIGFVWDPLEDSWHEMFQQIVDYKDKHGDTLVPAKFPDNLQLGIWVTNQRCNGKNDKLSLERIDKLNEIGFVWDPFEDSWNEMFQQIVEYKDIHGDTLVPAKYPDNLQLTVWIDTQRQNRKNKKMAPGRIAKLNEIGFVWDVLEEAWEDMLQQLKQYKDEHGDTLVPKNSAENPRLGRWVFTQRNSGRKNNSLAQERVDKLNEIGFIWDPFEDSWNEMFQQIVEYKDKHGDTLVPAKYPENRQFGTWVVTQRYQHKCKQGGKDSPLTGERIDKLNEISFVWDAYEAAWHTKYNKLCSFYKRYGHTRIPISEQEHKELYSWCMHQRYSKAKGRLKRKRCDQLKKINFDFFTRKIAKGSSLIENIIIYELERMGHEFDMKNEVFFGVNYKYRPDGVILVDEAFAIFFEVDERHHSGYSIKKEHHRMEDLRKEAETQGYEQVTFVRVSTACRKQISCNESLSQLKFVSKHLHELKSSTQLKPDFSVYYIDYPGDHHHVLASKERFDEVNVLNSQL